MDIFAEGCYSRWDGTQPRDNAITPLATHSVRSSARFPPLYADAPLVSHKGVSVSVSTQFASIPTDYKGTTFRSRTEARWAATFDGLSWDWVYEPCDLNGWIPDFQIATRGSSALLVEVKPALTAGELRQFIPKIDRAASPYEVLLVGSTWWWGTGMWDTPQIGLLSDATQSLGGRAGRPWTAASLTNCDHGDHYGLMDEAGAYQCRFCGLSMYHHACSPITSYAWQNIWGSGQNLTQWFPG